MKQLEFPEKDKFYTLISITNKDNTAIHPFFQSLIGCICCDFNTTVLPNGFLRFHLHFVQKPNGTITNKNIHSSPILTSEYSDDLYKITTQNRIYLLKEYTQTIHEPLPIEGASDLIELYLMSSPDYLALGYYYDSFGTVSKLILYVHSGMFMDSYLITSDKDARIICRFLKKSSCLFFYGTKHTFQNSNTKLLIHNVSEECLSIKFENHETLYKIESLCTEMISGKDLIEFPES